jgi:predicted RNase H-like nuclease (RuvC/YqgF family)
MDVVRLTRDQIRGRQEKAVRFTETVLGDPGRAQEIRDESLEDYAARRKFEIANPRRIVMAKRRKTVAELEAEIDDLQDQVEDLESTNQELEDQLDAVADIVTPEEEEEEDEDDEQGE